MEIQLLNTYESLHPFKSETLAPFTIITGKNGSGKTQLLKLLANNNQNKDFVNITEIPVKYRVQAEGIEVSNNGGLTNDKLLNTIQARLLPSIDYIKRNEFLLFLIEEDIYLDWDNINRQKLLSNKEEYFSLLLKLNQVEYNYTKESIRKITVDEEVNILKRIQPLHEYFFEFRHTIPILKKTSESANKKIIDLTIQDLLKSTFHGSFLLQNNLFHTKIEECFFGYAKNRQNNRILHALNIVEKQGYDTISDEEFIKINTPPWEKINSIFKQYGFNFYVNSIEKDEFNDQFSYTFNLFKNDTTNIIPLEKLSSGEKIIFGLIIKLFIAKRYNELIVTPNLLLLDEPDAHLHPEMSKLLLDVLENTFVKEFNIKVIMTTHSPTTVALAPEDSIYELKNGENTSLKKVSKDYALNLLTGFIPTLSIDYKNHRQVFVESPIDLKYYQLLSDKHFDESEIKPKHKLYFISNALGKGNCDSVKDIVKAIRHSGNKTSFGIIDWDNKSEQFDNIVIHGYGKRYSIENFLFDPIYLFGILIDKKKYSVREHFNLPEYYDSSCLVKDSKDKLQEYCDYVVNELVLKNSLKATNLEKEYSGLVEVKYNKQDITINIPKWWLVCKGHKELIPVLKEQAIPNLFKCFPKNHEIEENLALIICKNYPLVPVETIQLIEQLGN